ncbi:unnamed protein product [Linum tenue]|uniref:Cytochrome P450 n=1 Tax=Linum tenue TaxID=586396 RepID=A0AAV0M6K5_9ROSI|nr:unnamed protein product [Linum tenue]
MALSPLLQQYVSKIPIISVTFIIITIAAALLIPVLIRYKNSAATTSSSRSRRRPPPPGPWKLPVLGNLHQLVSDLPHHRLRDLAQTHGPDVMGLQLGELSYIVVSSPEAAREVLKAHDLNFATRPWLLVSEIVFYGAQNIGLAPYGEHWRQMRKICVMELLSSKRVSSFRPIRESEVSKLAAAVYGGVGGSVDLGGLVAAATSGITFRAAFGMAKETMSKEATFSGLIEDIVVATGGLRVTDVYPSLKFLPYLTGYRSHLTRMHLATDALLQEIVDEHKVRRDRGGRSGEGAADDLVDVLLNLQEDESHELEIPLTTEAIKAVILDIFLAGIETSSTTVEWTMSELMRSPDVMRRVQEEVRRTIGGEKNVDEECLHDLTYLDLVIQESLRLHPPLPLLLPRVARDRVEIMGYEIPVGTKVIINAWAIGRDSRCWQEADEFKPERFLNRASDFESIPFGSGRRMCPGMSSGLAVVKLVLAKLLYHFDWQLPVGITPETLDMTERFGSGVRRKHSLHLIPIAHDIAML